MLPIRPPLPVWRDSLVRMDMNRVEIAIAVSRAERGDWSQRAGGRFGTG